MDASQRNANAINKSIAKLTRQYIQRFETILALVPLESTDSATTGINETMMGVETGALVRVAEDTLRLTRQLQELWLFGNLDTLGKSQVEMKMEEDARAVADGIGMLGSSEDVGERTKGDEATTAA